MKAFTFVLANKYLNRPKVLHIPKLGLSASEMLGTLTPEREMEDRQWPQ